MLWRKFVICLPTATQEKNIFFNERLIDIKLSVELKNMKLFPVMHFIIWPLDGSASPGKLRVMLPDLFTSISVTNAIRKECQNPGAHSSQTFPFLSFFVRCLPATVDSCITWGEGTDRQTCPRPCIHLFTRASRTLSRVHGNQAVQKGLALILG